MGENNSGDMLKNIERIQSLSRLMSNGSQQADGERIMNALAAAKSMGIIGGPQRSEMTAFENNDGYELTENDGGSEKLRVVKAAIPFLDREYQKTLFLAVKLMEMNENFDAGALSLQCQSIREQSDEEQREAMLRAVRGQLSGENGRKLDVVLKVMEAGRLVSKLRRDGPKHI